MKLKLKMVALAASLASLAGGAQADLTLGGGTDNNGSFSLMAFNTVTFDWYIRDLGYLINDFMPSTVTTSVGDGSVVGNKTPDAGLLIDGSVKSNFSDATFATWFAAQPASDVRLGIAGVKFDGTAVSRLGLWHFNRQLVGPPQREVGPGIVRAQRHGLLGVGPRQVGLALHHAGNGQQQVCATRLAGFGQQLPRQRRASCGITPGQQGLRLGALVHGQPGRRHAADVPGA